MPAVALARVAVTTCAFLQLAAHDADSGFIHSNLGLLKAFEQLHAEGKSSTDTENGDVAQANALEDPLDQHGPMGNNLDAVMQYKARLEAEVSRLRKVGYAQLARVNPHAVVCDSLM